MGQCRVVLVSRRSVNSTILRMLMESAYRIRPTIQYRKFLSWSQTRIPSNKVCRSFSTLRYVRICAWSEFILTLLLNCSSKILTLIWALFCKELASLFTGTLKKGWLKLNVIRMRAHKRLIIVQVSWKSTNNTQQNPYLSHSHLFTNINKLDQSAASTRSYLTDVNYQNASHDPDYWMARLQNLMSTRQNGDNGSNMLDNRVADENLCLNSMNSQKVSLIRQEVGVTRTP